MNAMFVMLPVVVIVGALVVGGLVAAVAAIVIHRAERKHRAGAEPGPAETEDRSGGKAGEP